MKLATINKLPTGAWQVECSKTTKSTNIRVDLSGYFKGTRSNEPGSCS